MNNYSYTKAEDLQETKFETMWFYVFLFLCGAMAIAGLTYLMCGNNGYAFVKNGEPSFALSFPAMRWITMFCLDLFGIATYFVWLSRITSLRPRAEINQNYITAGFYIVLFMLWALFTFGLNLPVVGFIILCLSVLVGIYCVYRYFNSSITAGVFACLFELWLMYLLMLNLAYIFL